MPKHEQAFAAPCESRQTGAYIACFVLATAIESLPVCPRGQVAAILQGIFAVIIVRMWG